VNDLAAQLALDDPAMREEIHEALEARAMRQVMRVAR